MDSLIREFYKDKRVLITGHTGFKGSWLCALLEKLGAKISGCALPPDRNGDNLFDLLKIENRTDSYFQDIRDFSKIQQIIADSKPEIVFHLAAQPLVRDSYDDPLYNYETNVMGTANVLQACKDIGSIKTIVNITTDKCYDNKEWDWPYRENDGLGGHDPYSASKACSEIVTASYRKSCFNDKGVGLASARAGNVIGGGDFSKDRIIPDILRSIIADKDVVLRNPGAVRPWQHVLDVLHGYLILGKNLHEDPKNFSEAFNFSPAENDEVTVEDVTKKFISSIGKGRYHVEKDAGNPHEAQMLKLDCSKALKKLEWRPKYNAANSISNTALWYQRYIKGDNPTDICLEELEKFINL